MNPPVYICVEYLELADFAARKRRVDPHLISRKSFDALFNAEPINGMFLDAKSIEALHRLRDGGWPSNAAGGKAMRLLEIREQLEEAGILNITSGKEG